MMAERKAKAVKPRAAKAAKPPPAVKREPGKREAAAIEAAKASMANRPKRPEMGDKPGDDLGPPHADRAGFGDLLSDTFGSASADFVNQSICRLEVVARPRGQKEIAAARDFNAAFAIMAAIAPRDEAETCIGEQFIGSHMLAMELLEKARHADTVEKLVAYGGLANKTLRTLGGADGKPRPTAIRREANA
jgi:hypothetical protein